MLPTAERLKTSQNIERVLKKGKRINSPYFTIYFDRGTDDSPPPRFRGAVVVGLKVSKKATERNRAKRKIHAAIREYRQNCKLAGDFVIILKKEIVNIDYQLIKSEITKCLNSSV